MLFARSLLCVAFVALAGIVAPNAIAASKPRGTVSVSLNGNVGVVTAKVRFPKRPAAGTTLRLERATGSAWNTLVRRRARSRSVTITWTAATPGAVLRLRVRVLRRGRTVATAYRGTVTVPSSSPTTPVPTSPAAPVPLITDTRTIGIPSPGSYPAVGVWITDPATGFRVQRFVDHSDLLGDYADRVPPQSAIVYSRYTPVNTTGEFVVVHGDNSTSAWVYRVSDGRRMTPLKFKPSLATAASRSLGEVNELRWDYTGQHPYRLYFVGRALPSSQAVAGENPAMSFYSVDINPSTGAQSTPQLIRDFSADFPDAVIGGTGVLMNDVEGDSSNDSRYWAWMVNVDRADGSPYRTYAVLVYDRETNTIVSRLQRSCAGVSDPCVTISSPSASPATYMTRPNMVEISPLGTRVLVHWERVAPGYDRDAEINLTVDGPKAFLKDFSDPIRVGADATHSGWAWDANGNELFVAQNNRNDFIEAVDIRDAATAGCSLVPGGAVNAYQCGTKILAHADLGYNGMHFGKIYDRDKRGWVYMSTYSVGSVPWAVDQNLLVKVQAAAPGGARLVRLGSSYNTYYDYRSEGSGALNFQATSIWATGNWGFTDGRGDVFQTELPSHLWTSLP